MTDRYEQARFGIIFEEGNETQVLSPAQVDEVEWAASPNSERVVDQCGRVESRNTSAVDWTIKVQCVVTVGDFGDPAMLTARHLEQDLIEQQSYSIITDFVQGTERLDNINVVQSSDRPRYYPKGVNEANVDPNEAIAFDVQLSFNDEESEQGIDV